MDLTRDLTIEMVDPTDEGAMREWFDLAGAARAHDHPDDPPQCWIDHRARLLAPPAGRTATAWFARSGGELVGVAVLTLTIMDNLDSAPAELLVAPSARRRGVARRLLAHVVVAARSAGRTRLFLEASEPLDRPGGGALFLAAVGARHVLAEQRHRLHLPPPDEAVFERLADTARAAAEGYELVQWSGPTPDRWLDDIAVLVARMSTDVPLDDLQLAPERWDAERIRERDRAGAARGVTRTVTAARGPDGRLVAFTIIMTRATVEGHAAQGDTLVAPEHRGHRLGLLVKLANLALVRAEHPALRTVDTYNADTNPYMVSINEAMGFRPLDRFGEWELDL